ncbi:hypothetical protein C8034_v010663 [Colletotrichum sidae]|uniref:2EXR domain-containing protein n=1 Tax=Colletotrichum sidae TaxID=1347389 RepID=A0A4R8T9Y2_9PEZI|nr:hypothetical protein C8034_v010663 [Colletotrichum sidae]
MSFTRFNELPPELRLMIWKEALPGDVPEIYFNRAFVPTRWPRINSTCLPRTPLVVDIDTPSWTQACRESRAFFFNSALSRITFRTCNANFPVPVREFRWDFDIFHSYPALDFFVPKGTPWIDDCWKKLHYISIDLRTTKPLMAIVLYLLRHLVKRLPNLRCLSFVGPPDDSRVPASWFGETELEDGLFAAYSRYATQRHRQVSVQGEYRCSRAKDTLGRKPKIHGSAGALQEFARRRTTENEENSLLSNSQTETQGGVGSLSEKSDFQICHVTMGQY